MKLAASTAATSPRSALLGRGQAGSHVGARFSRGEAVFEGNALQSDGQIMPQTLQLLGQVPVVEDEADEVLDDAQTLSRPIGRRVDHPQHVDLVDGGRRAGGLGRQRARKVTRRRGRECLVDVRREFLGRIEAFERIQIGQVSMEPREVLFEHFRSQTSLSEPIADLALGERQPEQDVFGCQLRRLTALGQPCDGRFHGGPHVVSESPAKGGYWVIAGPFPTPFVGGITLRQFGPMPANSLCRDPPLGQHGRCPALRLGRQAQ